jgi:Domain of unknown function (DUF4123)
VTPTSEAVTRRIFGASAGHGEVYAILDCARDRRIYRDLGSSPLGSRCLYEGPIPGALAENAPYLVPLKAWDSYTNKLLDQGWGQSWGIWLASSAPVLDVRRHFRRFLMVADEQGQSLYFRYYDPRVFRVYLPTCNERELGFIFGPVERFWCESEDGKAVVEYGRRGPELEQRLLRLAA